MGSAFEPCERSHHSATARSPARNPRPSSGREDSAPTAPAGCRPETDERRGDSVISRFRWPLIAAALAAVIATGLALGGNGETNKKTFEYAIGLWGDFPYSDVQAQTGVPNLIADMNDAGLEFTVHDGDLK